MDAGSSETRSRAQQPHLLQTIHTTKPVTSLAANSLSNLLYAGSEDGILRVYRHDSTKVIKAVKIDGGELASIALVPQKPPVTGSLGNVWLASGTEVLLFGLDGEDLVVKRKDAARVHALGEDAEDVLNEVGPFSYIINSDGGSVGVVDLDASVGGVSRMRMRHDNICGSVQFIPERPAELVSGGYDCALLHFDFRQCSLLSRFDISTPADASGVRLAPPFILSVALSPTGLLAASTANGNIWIGTGGEKTPPSKVSGKAKRSRRWEGLVESKGFFTKVAEGPVVAIAFLSPSELVFTTLLGTIECRPLTLGQPTLSSGSLELGKPIWGAHVLTISKVNSLKVCLSWFAVGGIGADDKGCLEVWQIPSSSSRALPPDSDDWT